MPSPRAAVLDLFAAQRCSAILRTQDRAAVRPALEAAIDGGFRIVEVTMNTPDCLDHVAALRERADLVVGVGTVLSVDDAKEAMAATFPSLEELAVLREEASGRLTLPLSFRLELRRLLAGGDPAARLGLSPGASGAELRRTAEQALERWRTFVNTGRAPFASIHASHTVVRALERLWTGSQS